MHSQNTQAKTNLISSSNVLLIAINVNTLSDVRRLLLQGHKNIAGLVVKSYKDRNSSLKLKVNHKLLN